MDLLSTSQSLNAFVQSLPSQLPYLAVDTEFIRETSYWPQLCLVQVAAGPHAAVIDVLSPHLDPTPLWELFKNPRILKVFHAARQDLEGLGRAMGQLPAPIFDTQVAAMACGFRDSISYEALVTHFLAHSLDKSQRVIDWSKRPLTPAQLAYALNDVVYLSQLYPLVSQQLKEWRREAWIQEEMDLLTCPKTYLPDLANAWKKVKGWAVLKGLNRHSFYFLVQLAAWREKQASLRDKPRRHILGDEELCGCVVSFQTQDKQTHYPGGEVQEVCQEIAHNILQLDPSLLPPVPWESPPAEDEKAAYKALSTLLQETATKAALAARLIGTRHDLERLIRQWRQGSVDNRQPLLSSWRHTLFGERALEVLDGILGQG